MNGFNSAVLACFMLTAAAFAFIPLTIASPFMLLRPTLLLSIWGVWLFIFAEGSSFLLDSVRLAFTRPRYTLDFHQRPSPARRAEPASKSPTTPLPTVYEFEPEIPENCTRADMTPPASHSRANSIKSARPAQDTSSPTSRRASSTLDLDEILQMKNSLRDKDRNDYYKYDLSPEGPSRLSSRRSSRAASSVDLRLSDNSAESGIATPKLSRSRTGSFTHTSNLPSRTGSTTSLGNVPESSRRHKRARTDGSVFGS
ncbi:hypothetical protein CERZMDRAFT_102103 [Cercospora zeae-maydis SCOH1-5]|uniref:Uncharacterized protein n=1 Tax=Cercospora zeae-maydis SCOH1-5 TaxID=717836 RepID=A0A6A6F288_9PEZI|nr:hypothetical protein CERZMDRAFT_102103 [Cercospora zeae-maydis SCOH1-5]